MSNFQLKEMSRDDLILLQEEIKQRLKSFRPYRIKERLTTCGNADCWCYDGSDLHGPYLYVSYRDGHKTKSVALGPKLEIWEMIEAVPAYPNVTDYLNTSNHKYEETAIKDAGGWVSYTLDEMQFEERYGCSKADDNFDRADKFWGKREDWQRYQTQLELHYHLQQIPYSPWSGWGVGNLKGIAILNSLETQGYYQK